LLHIIRAALRKFIQLEDTPNSYSGLAGKLFKVNSAETALEVSTNTDSEIAEAVNVAANVIEKIAEVEVSSDCDYVEFTGLDGNSAWFYVLFAVFKNPTANDLRYKIYVNGDTADSNYYTQETHADGSSDSYVRLNGPSIAFGYDGENSFCHVIITKDPAGYFRWISENNYREGSAISANRDLGCKINTIDNITSLRVYASTTGGIGAGSKLILFKARRG